MPGTMILQIWDVQHGACAMLTHESEYGVQGVVGAEVARPFGGTIRLRDGGFDQAPKAGRGLRC
jgi:hypothetical protein